MMRSRIVICAMLIANLAGAQSDSASVHPVSQLSGPGDQFASCLAQRSLCFMTAAKSEYLLSDLPDPQGNAFRIERVTLDENNIPSGQSEPILTQAGRDDDGTVFFHEQSQTYWFSSANNYGDAQGRKLKLYSCRFAEGKTSMPRPFIHNNSKHDICHPWLNEEGNRLFFSTDRSGGSGGMDIWYCNMLVDGWSQPIWAGEAVNTEGHELFPTLGGDFLYFSSNGQEGAAGFDLYKTSDESHWKSVIPVPPPINGPADDMQMVFTGEFEGFFTSNRNGELAGDDIFNFRIFPDSDSNNTLIAKLICKGSGIQGELVKVYGPEGSLLLTEETDADGSFNISFLEAGIVYKVKAEDLSPLILRHTFMHVYDQDGVLMQIIPLDTDDSFRFETLPTDENALGLMENPDESVLSIDLEGQIYDKKPGDIGRGQPVYISSKDGELLALTYTSATGRFAVDDIRPLKDYVLQVDEDSRAQRVIIQNEGKEIVIPLIDQAAEFGRLTDSEAIELVDEFQRPIQIAESDVFIVKNIYYKYNSAALNEVAKSQLVHLATILESNSSMQIELSSHTDSRGEGDYNLDLSSRRANSAVVYLVEQGIEAARLVAKGFGETRLINRCADGADCNETEHALNRRTEIRIFFE